MWLNEAITSNAAIDTYRATLRTNCPNYIVIDGLFNESKLDHVIQVLKQEHHWKTQQHTYTALYVNNTQWHNSSEKQRFVQRDVWQRKMLNIGNDNDVNPTSNIANEFLVFLRQPEFMSFLSKIFSVALTDKHVENPDINTNYFRLNANDFVKQHADDSPGREVCMLLYLNKHWQSDAGGELTFSGNNNTPIHIAPRFNRCVLFAPSSKGSEHWVESLNARYNDEYRYNITSWYWSE